MTMFFLCFGLVGIYVSVTPSRAHLKSLVPMNKNRSEVKLKRIVFYHQANFQTVRNVNGSFNSTFFEQCQVKSCLLSFNKSDAPFSDAGILNWEKQHSPVTFKRPRDQVWIFIQHEAPVSYKPKKLQAAHNYFNWTMTYSEQSDLPLPYGALKLKSLDSMYQRNYLAVSKNKTKDALWIVSHCPTLSKREQYVDILKQYVNIDILGKCGQKWDCGHAHNHEAGDCFSILNSTYRYYLAFENVLCTDYITEKFYENYKYDIIQVSRAGDNKHRPNKLDKNVYVSTEDFKDAHELGRYLRSLSLDKEKYAKILSEKDRYEAVPYVELLKERMCEICMRLNKLDDYKKVYKDVYGWMLKTTRCFKPTDI